MVVESVRVPATVSTETSALISPKAAVMFVLSEASGLTRPLAVWTTRKTRMVFPDRRMAAWSGEVIFTTQWTSCPSGVQAMP